MSKITSIFGKSPWHTRFFGTVVLLLIGPSGYASSFHLIGPGTWGTMHSVAFHPTDANVFITGVDMGLGFLTTDGGASWSVLGTLPPGLPSGYPGDQGYLSALFDPKDPAIRWVAGGMGLYKTVDAGNTWQLSFGGSLGYSPYALAIDPTDSNIVYAAGGGPLRWYKPWITEGKAIRKTTDGGRHWTKTYSAARDADPASEVNWFKIQIDPKSAFSAGLGHQRIYALKHPASNAPGLYRSEDGGASWALLSMASTGLSDIKVTDLTLLTGETRSTIYVTITYLRNGKTLGAVYSSNDHGSTWQENDAGLNLSHAEYPIISSCGSDPRTLYWHPGQSDRSIFKSVDQGASWRSVLSNSGDWNAYPDFDGMQRDILLLGDNGNWGNTTAGIVQWSNVISCSPLDPRIVMFSHSNGIFMTRDGGNSWQDLMFEYGERSASYEKAAAKYGAGRPPSPYTHKRRSTGAQQVVPTVVAVDPYDSGNVAIGYDDVGLYISRDGNPAKDSQTWWEWAYWGMTLRERFETRAIVYDPRVQGRIYVGTMGNVHVADFQAGNDKLWKLYRSDDGGVTFVHVGPDTSSVVRQLINAGTDSKFSFGFRSIAIDPVDNNIVYAATPCNMYKTTDGGVSWTEVLGPPLLNVAKLAGNVEKHHFLIKLDPSNSRIVYAGTAAGLFRSPDAGKSWVRVNTADFGTIRSMSICGADPKVMTVVASNAEYVHTASAKSELFISSDGGESWTKQTDSTNVQFATIHPEYPDVIYRALYASDITKQPQGLYRSLDRGGHWTAISSGTPMSYKGYYKYDCEVVVDPRFLNRIYVPTYCGVWTTLDDQVAATGMSPRVNKRPSSRIAAR